MKGESMSSPGPSSSFKSNYLRVEPRITEHGYHEIGWTQGILLMAVFLNFTGLLVPIIGPDGTLYANIAKTMAHSNNFIELLSAGTDWLDKPHFPFWVTALSFKLFGIHTWSYKLPAVLFLLIGARYTFLFARQFYKKETALWAAIILLTAEHIVISNNDVRAEPYLTGVIIGSVYHFYKAIGSPWLKHLLIGAAFAGAAIMTKGIFSLLPIGGAIVGGLVFSKHTKQLFHIKWLLGFLFVFIFILPELFCLWYQFDRHPEKLVFSRHNVSGLEFFFWDSQFGRFTNTGPIRGRGDLSFFFHTILWAFLPWSFLLYAAVWRKLKFVFRKEGTLKTEEWYTLSGAVPTFLLFSLSRFQLPHYTNILFPFFAIITADYLFSTSSLKTTKSIARIQTGIIVLLWLAGTVLQVYFQPAFWFWWALFSSIGVVVVSRSLLGYSKERIMKICRATSLTSILLNIFLNLFFYPSLLKYQAGSELAFYLNKNFEGQSVAAFLDRKTSDLEFYLHGKLIHLGSEAITGDSLQGSHLLFLPKEDVQKLTRPFAHIASFQDFPVSRLSWSFFNLATRVKETKEYWLLKI